MQHAMNVISSPFYSSTSRTADQRHMRPSGGVAVSVIQQLACASTSQSARALILHSS